jgi:hypothetical protein
MTSGREAPDDEVSVHSMQIGRIVSLPAETATVEPRIVTCRSGAAAVARTGPGKPTGGTRFDGFTY